MTTRNEQIKGVSNVVRRYIESGLGDDTIEDVTKRMRQTNETTGWAIETSGSKDHVIRHEDVVLTDAELTKAVQMAWEAQSA